MKFRFAPFALVAAAALAGPAVSQGSVQAISPAGMTAYLRGQGLLVETLTVGSRQVLRSEMEGSKFLVFFTDCNSAGAACGSMQFYAGFKPNNPSNVQVMNEWNKTKRYSRAYIDREGDPVVEMDVATAGGLLTKTLMDDNFVNWRLVMRAFKATIFTGGAAAAKK